MATESYDVLAVCQVESLRPLLSVRLVQAGIKRPEVAARKVREMQRATENSICGEEFFVVVEHGTYWPGETWVGTKTPREEAHDS